MPAMWRRLGRFPAAVGGFAALGAVCLIPPANANPAPLVLTWDCSNDGMDPMQFNWDDYGAFPVFGDHTVPGSDETWTGWNYAGNDTDFGFATPAWDLNWNIVFDAPTGGVASGDHAAFVTANMVVTNNDPFNSQTFSLLMSLPVDKTITNPLTRGSIVGTIVDMTGDDATVSALASSSIYTARIDSVDERSLMVYPFAANAGGPYLSAPVGPEDFGIPVWEVGSQSVDNNIQLYLEFELSAGDQASFTAIFEVVPGAGGLPLLAALGLLAGRRRRRT